MPKRVSREPPKAKILTNLAPERPKRVPREPPNAKILKRPEALLSSLFSSLFSLDPSGAAPGLEPMHGHSGRPPADALRPLDSTPSFEKKSKAGADFFFQRFVADAS